MNTKDNLISNIHKLFRKDPYITAVLESIGTEFDKIEEKLILLKKEYLFSSISLEQILRFEKLLNFTTTSIAIEGKRLEIESRWKSSGKCNIELLQSIADTWNAGKIIVRFVDRSIQFGFIGEIESTYDLKSLQDAISKVKPAHLSFDFIYSEKIDTNLLFNSFLCEELEEDFIEKNKSFSIDCNYYKVIYQGVNEDYGI